MRRWYQFLIITLLTLIPVACNNNTGGSDKQAPGNGGISSNWSYAGKLGIGTSYEKYTDGAYKDTGATGKISKVWFSIAQGIITETACRRIDKAQIRDLQFLVTGNGFFHEERKDTTSRIEYVYTDTAGRPLSLAYKVTNIPAHNQYRIEKYIFTDPDRDVLFLHINFTSYDDGITPFILLNPHMNNTGSGDVAHVTGDTLTAGENDTFLAVLSNTPFVKTSAGFVGKSDGWQDLSDNGVMDWEYDKAEHPGGGNIALMAQLSGVEHTTLSFDIAVGFGTTEGNARRAAGESLSEGWEQVLKKYNGEGNHTGWSDYLEGLSHLSGLVPYTGDNGKELYASAMVLKAQEDKENPGALIASLSIPWGNTVNADTNATGYRAVWPRDFYQCASALLALGDSETPLVSFRYLKTIQVTDSTPGNNGAGGWFLQKTEVDGTLEWMGVQLDQTAMPIMLGWKLWKAGVLNNIEIISWYNSMLKPAALFLKDGGYVDLGWNKRQVNPPWTHQERWEEQEGYSPSTTAATITGLLCASDIARHAGDGLHASEFKEKADVIEANIERYMFTTSGTLGDGHYYLRITPDTDPNNNSPLNDGNGAMNGVNEKNILDAGFLELVRYGVRKPLDYHILETLEEIDNMEIDDIYRLRYEFWFNGKKYPGFRRYGADGYGERTTDGSNFRDGGDDRLSQRGRVWPFFTGERGHYELERIKAEHNGNITGQQLNELRDTYVAGMEQFANGGLMLPEQVWDDRGSNATHQFIPGEGTNSATPLAWTHAEYIKLVRSLYDRNTWDSYRNVRDHYGPLSAFSRTYNRVFFRGTPNDWGTKAMQLAGDYTWEIMVAFPDDSNNSFKFDVYGDWSLSFGDNDNDGYGDLDGNNITITTGAGNYLIRFYDSTEQYWIVKQ